jgi:hypothetical protein
VLTTSAVFPVVLDFRGGRKTDALVEHLRHVNAGLPVFVLDNASGQCESTYVTHRNVQNSNVGGGLRDCLDLGRQAGAAWILFVANDVTPVSPLCVQEFVNVVNRWPNVVHVSASLTATSAQAAVFPWMVSRGGSVARQVVHADILVSLLNVEFVQSFGGFPPSKGGWGYSWELAFHARRADRPVVVLDSCVIEHLSRVHDVAWKRSEATKVYMDRYGCIPWSPLKRQLQTLYRAVAGSGL